MSSADIVAEKVRSLSEPEARSVLEFISRLQRRAPKPSELLRMAPPERDRILAAQMAKAEELYRQDPDVVIEDWEEPLDYA